MLKQRSAAYHKQVSDRDVVVADTLISYGSFSIKTSVPSPRILFIFIIKKKSLDQSIKKLLDLILKRGTAGKVTLKIPCFYFQ